MIIPIPKSGRDRIINNIDWSLVTANSWSLSTPPSQPHHHRHCQQHTHLGLGPLAGFASTIPIPEGIQMWSLNSFSKHTTTTFFCTLHNTQQILLRSRLLSAYRGYVARQVILGPWWGPKTNLDSVKRCDENQVQKYINGENTCVVSCYCYWSYKKRDSDTRHNDLQHAL